MADLVCPACKATLAQAGFTFRCPSCKGKWVAEDVVVGMLEERAATLIELPWMPRADDKVRNCAECGAAMQTVDLGEVQLDRCPSHGVWFDDTELAALLGEAKQFRKPEAAHAGLVTTLRKLFTRG
jgi:Zn-finger nucleic acid-binding protein